MSARRRSVGSAGARRPQSAGQELWQVELRQAIEAYRSLFDHAAFGIYRVTPTRQLVAVNPALARMLGYGSPEEVIRAVRSGARFYANSLQARAFWDLMEHRGVVSDFDMEYIRQDGSPAWGRVSAWTVPGGLGKVLYYEGTVEAFTERRLAEEALRASEDRYRDLVEHCGDLLCTHDLEGRILSVNRVAMKFLGYPLDELVEKKTIRDILHPDVRGQFDAYVAELKQQGAASGLTRVVTAAGEERVWEYHNTLRRDGVGQPIVRGLAHDVTDRVIAKRLARQSEARYQDLFQRNPMPMYVVDRETLAVLAVNDAAVRHYGYTRDEFLRMSSRDIPPPEDVPAFLEYLARIRQSGLSPSGEWRHRSKSGATLDVAVQSYTLIFSGRDAWLVMIADLTERKRLETEHDVLRRKGERERAQLKVLSHRLVETQETERRMLARELHDETGQALISLLVGLRTIDQAQTLGQVKGAVRELRQLVALTIEEVRRLSVGMHPAVLDDLGLVPALGRYVREHVGNSPRIRLHTDHLGPARLPAAAERTLYRIAQEAITNALRHGAARHIEITLRRKAGVVELRLRDDGKGFDVKGVLEASSAERFGLVGMRERANLVGGSVTIRSRPGRGTTVSVTLPLGAPSPRRMR